ncbi:SAP domain-containing protein [Methanobrevibacter sp.]|uniref:SAP domain-containing protein n=1 Tax=Methanobrevibacter sp. TaxID=66852 RepID=UPI00388D8FB4
MAYNNDLEKFSLKYGDRIPRDYDLSEIQFTFDCIYLVLKSNAEIDDAVKEVSYNYGISDVYLKDYLIENKYIINRTNKNEFSKQLKKYNTKSLKKMLKKQGLKTSGKREKIEKRIFEHNILKNSYYLSSNSKTFYKNKKRRIKIFNDYLSDKYYFDEFNEFYMDNYRKKLDKIPVAFINLHINKASEDESHERFILNNQIMANHFNKKEKYKKMLEYELRLFCMNLNPIWKTDDLSNHMGVNKDSYKNLNFIKSKLSKNIVISAFYVIWDSFDFNTIIVSKYDAYRCLKDILNNKNLNKINSKLDEKFYSNEDLKIKKITQKTLFDF